MKKKLSFRFPFRIAGSVPAAALFAAASAVPSFGAQVWVSGVSKESGWVDVNKTGNDGMLCWAAATSNVAGWWQSQSSVPAGIPQTGAEIYQTMKDTFEDAGNYADVGMKWYFGGTDAMGNAYKTEAFRVDVDDPAATGGYWKDWLIENGGASAITTGKAYRRTYEDEDLGNGLATTFIDLMTSGCGITLSLVNNTGGRNSHAVTLWGMTYDEETRKIYSLYVTDSDDGKTELTEYKVDYQTQTLTYGDGKDVPIVNWEQTKVTMAGYYIEQWEALNLPFAAIPEPSAFGLLAGTCALALAASRRRRK